MSPQNAIMEAVVKTLTTAATKAGKRISRGPARENERRPFVEINIGGQPPKQSHSGEWLGQCSVTVDALSLTEASEISHACRLAIEASDAAPVAITGHSVSIYAVIVQLTEAEEASEAPSTLAQHQERSARNRTDYEITFTFKSN